MNDFYGSLTSLLGLGIEPKDLTFGQISLRGVIVFAAAIIMIRLSDRRSLTKKSPFDVVLVVILASVLARAINGSSSFFPTLGGGAVLVFLHRALAFASCIWPGLNPVIKGSPRVLIKEGKLQRQVMRKQHISDGDIQEDLRLRAKIEELEKVKIARLEANGEISFILRAGS